MELKGKKVLVTGAGGFLGKHVVLKLAERGVLPGDVFAPSSSELDLRSFDNCIQAVRGRDIIIHIAGVTGNAELHRDHPGKVFYDNLIMGAQLLEAARLQGVEKIVTIGSAAEYPADATPPFREEDLWAGFPEVLHAPYAMAKKMLLVQSQAYRKEYGLSAIHLLMTNFYGPFDKNDSGPIPSFIQRIKAAKESGVKEVPLWGTGKPTRDFLYVEDAAEAIVLATELYDGDEPVNIGSGHETSIQGLAMLIAELMDFEGQFVFDVTKPDGQMRRALDVSRAEQEFGFRAKTDLKAGLRKTLAWYNDRI